MAFLNKLDLLPEESKAKDLADLILADDKNEIDRAILGSLKNRSYLIVRRKTHGRYLP
jgi:hypothetical protein